MIHEEDSAYSHTHSHDSLQRNDTEQNQLRDKAYGLESRGDQRQLPESSLHGATQPH